MQTEATNHGRRLWSPAQRACLQKGPPYRSVSADMQLAAWLRDGMTAAQVLHFPSIWGEGLHESAH